MIDCVRQILVRGDHRPFRSPDERGRAPSATATAKLWRCDLKNWWCAQNLDGVKQLFKSVNNILMVCTKLCRCDPENRWCDQNLDGVKQIFKSVNNILMVCTKLWRCDLKNWWCDQMLMVWNKFSKVWTTSQWCEQNYAGVILKIDGVIKIYIVWTKFSRVWSTSWWCEQNYDSVILKIDGVNKFFRCDQMLMVWWNDILVWTNVHFLEIVWSHRMVWCLHMFFPDVVLRTEDMWQRYNQLSPVFPIIMSCLRSPSTTKPLVTH